ncbi:hypothetical protein BJX99DRAFT_250326 [Aspergillus californicus]
MDKISKWLFGYTYHRVLLLGDDGSGKTSFIDRLKYNETPFQPPPPTRNFYSQTVQFPGNCDWNIWECRTTWHLLPFIRQMLSPETLVVWLHDCGRETKLSGMFSLVLEEMAKAGCRYIWVVCNKQDLPGSERKVQEAQQMYQLQFVLLKGELRGRFLTNNVSAKTGMGVYEVLEELQLAVRKVNLGSSKRLEEPANQSEREIKMEPEPVKDTTSVVEEEISQDTLEPDIFWERFLSGDLPAWNHYTFIKAGYIVVLEAGKGQTAFDIADTFQAHMDRLRESSPELFNTPLAKPYAQSSRTATIFWILHLQNAIRDYRVHTMMKDLPARKEFYVILRHSPWLMNTALWKGYYFHDPASNPTARENWIEPGRRALPTDTQYLRDPVIIPAAGKDADRLIRYAFAVTRYIRKQGVKRDDIISQALAILQRTTIRLRSIDPSIPSYSETQVCFWMQMVEAALRSVDTDKELSHFALSTYESFQETFHLDAMAWTEHYSNNVWESIGARLKAVSPDIKPLPHMIHHSTPETEIKNQHPWKTTPKIPSIEILTFYATLMTSQDARPNANHPNHATLLTYLYNNLTAETPDPSKTPLTLGQKAIKVYTESSGPGPGVASATHRIFWIQHIGVALSASRAEQDRGLPVAVPVGMSTFAEFITRNLHLAWEDLPGIYYSPEIWNCKEAREGVVNGDRRGVGSERTETGWVHV